MRPSFRGLAAALAFVPLLVPAVSLDPQGLGQALIFPYYTVRAADGDAFNTFVSIVNSTADTKALRVRFREGRNAREVASFNLFLAGGDMWTGAVIPLGGGAQLVTADRSCTSPGFADFAVSAFPFMNFTNASYTGANADGAGDGLARTMEGFVEVIEMATLTASAPRDCDSLRNATTLPTAAPSGGLSGTLTLFNVASGMDFTVNADALANLASRPFYRPINDPYPDFNAAEVDPTSSGVANGRIYRAAWDRGVDAVSSVLMAKEVVNEFVIDNATRSRTDWVVTMPTRRLYGTGATIGTPFAKPFAAGPLNPACPTEEQVTYLVFDREARPYPIPTGDFPEHPPGPVPTILCWSVTTIPAVNGSLSATQGPLGSANAISQNLSIGPNMQNGWIDLTLQGRSAVPAAMVSGAASVLIDPATGATTTGALKFTGLPALGLMVRTFRNGNLTCGSGVCQGNYGGAFPHRYVRSVEPGP